MKLVSNLAVALTLSLGAATMVSAPAVAKKNEQAQAQLTLSPDLNKPAAAVEGALKTKDYATAEAQLAMAEPLAKTDEDRYYVGTRRLTIAIAKQDNPGIARALDALLANPRTPAADLPAYNGVRGSIAIDLKQGAQALPYLLKARQLGYNAADLPINFAQAYAAAGQTNQAIAELDKAIAAETAAGRKAPEAWYGYIVTNLFATRNLPGAEQWLPRLLQAYPKTTSWRTAVSNYRAVVDPSGTAFTKGQKLELYRLMRATNVLSDQVDYFKYASAALESGLPWEAVAIIDAGRTAGKIPAGDPDFARVYKVATDSVAGDRPPAAYEKQARDATVGAKAMEGANINLAAGDYAQAAELYGLALTRGGVNADDANIRQGFALANLGRKDEAKAAFAKVTAAPLADMARFWIIWLNMPQPAA